tara:strand:+ start:1064 stop:1390 length:327 start_codon:yes stop_codon:yes gene_type:complete
MNDLTPRVIDLTAARAGALNESWLTMFGSAIKLVLQQLFGEDIGVPIQIKGSRSDITAFANTVRSEKRYMSAMRDYGLQNPRTYKSKAELTSSIAKFERTTGLKWPFK